MASEMEETLKRIHSEHQGVLGVVVTNNEGVIIRSTLSESVDAAENYSGIITEIVERARMVLKDSDELTFLKIRTKRVEYIVVPDRDYNMITLLNPSVDTNS